MEWMDKELLLEDSCTRTPSVLAMAITFRLSSGLGKPSLPLILPIPLIIDLSSSLIGGDFFYLRACDPNVSGSAAYCPRWDNTNLSWLDAVFSWRNGALSLNDTYQECLGDSIPLGMAFS